MVKKNETINLTQSNLGTNRDGNRFHTSENDGYGCIEIILISLSFILFLITFPISIFFAFKVVFEYERAVILRLGRLRSGGARGPGMFFILPCTDDFFRVQLRTVTFNVPPQEVLTKDSVSIAVDAVVYYKVHNPLDAVIQIENYAYTTKLLAATTLRNILGTRSLTEVLAEREIIARTMKIALDEATVRYGINVERVEIKNVALPKLMQRAMAAEAEAMRGARAKVIMAEGEKNASQRLKEASNIMAENPMALQLRYLQTLATIAIEQESTIMFPLPLNLFVQEPKQ